LVPIVGWIRSYKRDWLKGDLVAGAAVAALVVPKNLGYAGIAGVPLQNGLYAVAAGTQAFRELDEYPADAVFPGIAVMRLDGGLFFATSDALEDRVRDVALSTEDMKAVVLDCGGVDSVDTQGSARLREILELTRSTGLTFRLARVKAPVRAVLERDGVIRLIGADKIHANVYQAVAAQTGSSGGILPSEKGL
jgi:sulfate permease, SulP family